MRTLNEDAIEYAANNLFTTELGYTEIIWGPEIAPEGSRMQEREFNEVVLRGRQRHSLRRMRLVKTPSAAKSRRRAARSLQGWRIPKDLPDQRLV
jgi:hypothetical protein